MAVKPFSCKWPADNAEGLEGLERLASGLRLGGVRAVVVYDAEDHTYQLFIPDRGRDCSACNARLSSLPRR